MPLFDLRMESRVHIHTNLRFFITIGCCYLVRMFRLFDLGCRQLKGQPVVTVDQPPHRTYPVQRLTRTTTKQLSAAISPTMPVSSSPDRLQNEQTSHIAADNAHLSNQPSISSPGQVTPRVASAKVAMPNTDVLPREKRHACTMCHKRSAGIGQQSAFP